MVRVRMGFRVICVFSLAEGEGNEAAGMNVSSSSILCMRWKMSGKEVFLGCCGYWQVMESEEEDYTMLDKNGNPI